METTVIAKILEISSLEGGDGEHSPGKDFYDRTEYSPEVQIRSCVEVRKKPPGHGVLAVQENL